MTRFPAVSFDHYWNMWNERDVSKVRRHLDLAVAEDFVFCDPLHFHTGRDALEVNVIGLRTEHPDAVFVQASGIDSHHNLHRYRWDFTIDGQVLLEGFDMLTLGDDGLIQRIDGFFGPLPPTPTAT